MADANTPGPGGYLLAWAVSVVVYSVVFSAATSISEGTGVGTAFEIFAFYGNVIGWVSIPFALVGVPIVHASCRRARSQWPHVIVAGVTGLLPMAVLGGFRDSADPWFWLMVPIATAIGRWSVVPLVRRRRQAAGLRSVRAAS